MRKLLTLACLLLAGVGYAQQSGMRLHSGKGFRYVDTILNAGPEQRFIPVLVAFMHLNAKPEDIISNYDSLKQPVHLIVPMGNCDAADPSFYFPAACYQREFDRRDKLMRKTVDSIADFIHIINKQYHCRAFVSGYLQGGELALMLTIYHPAQVIASFPLAATVPDRLNMMLRASRSGYVPIYLYKGGNEEPSTALRGHENRVTQLNGYRNVYLTVYPHQDNIVTAKMKHDFSALMDEELEKYRVNFGEKRLNKYYPLTEETILAIENAKTARAVVAGN